MTPEFKQNLWIIYQQSLLSTVLWAVAAFFLIGIGLLATRQVIRHERGVSKNTDLESVTFFIVSLSCLMASVLPVMMVVWKIWAYFIFSK